MTKIKTAGYIASETGFARLLRFPKFGRDNTFGIRHQQPKSQVLRLDLITAGNTIATSLTLVSKVYSLSDGSPRLTLTSSSPLPDGVEVYIEETTTHWVLIARHSQPGDVVAIELVSPAVSGFAEDFPNEPYTYVPTGHLIKPLAANTRRSLSSPATSQWLKIATIKTIANFSRYSALLALMDAEAPTANSAVNLFSFQVNHQNTGSPPTVALIEHTDRPQKTFEVHYVASVASGIGTVELWVKADLANSTIAASLLSEAEFYVDRHVSAQFHDRGAWTASAPANAVRAKSSVVESGLTMLNGWSAASGYSATRSTGVVVASRIATLNMTVTGGIMADNTKIATVAAAYAPTNTVDATVLVTDAAGAHSLGRASIYSTGDVVLRGAIVANTKVTIQATWPIGGF